MFQNKKIVISKKHNKYTCKLNPFFYKLKHINFKKIKLSFKTIYSIISIISTLAVFSAIILFFVGELGLENSSDDDLIMRDISKQIPNNLAIASISMLDIHGFGNDSIIVLADDGNFAQEGRTIANQILIFDKVENDILNQIYHLFGYGSNHKLSYIFSLQSYYDSEAELGYMLKLLDTVELTGDTSKELVVSFTSLPAGTSVSYEIGILSYSFQTQSYYMLGTYPSVAESTNMEEYIESNFHDEDPKHCNFYNKNERFNLDSGCSDDNDFFIDSRYGNPYLVRTKMIWGDKEGHADPHKHIISVFSSEYLSETDEIKWNLLFSKETTDYIPYCTKDYVFKFLRENDMGYIIDNSGY